jgi:stage V sporulation protein AE
MGEGIFFGDFGTITEKRRVFMEYVWAFLVGGLFCVIGQVLIDLTKLTPARILVGYVVMGVLLTGVGLYGPLVELAGAGATVPLTGFGYTLALGVQKAVEQYGLFGALTGGLTATAGGIAAAIALGFLAGIVGKSKAK